MSVTASRMGSSPLTIDWSNLASVPAGTGPAARKFGPDSQFLAEMWGKLAARFDRGEVGFFRAPIDEQISQSVESQALADILVRQDTFRDCLFLGIGGSSLGPMSLLSALQEKCRPTIRFHFMDNPDPLEWKSTIAKLNPSQTLICAVTKSGGTFETMAQLLLALEWVGKERWKTHVVAITDPQKGELKAFAAHEGIPALSIHPSMGGRFSVFSPVGLFPAALAGLSIKDFLQGAQQVHDYILKAPHEKNPLFILAQDLIRHFAKRPIHVCMPYSMRLKHVANWFVQLWAESLGKDGKGFTPVAALGPTDQHSILQLLRDGPDDKVTWFLTVDEIKDPIAIPRVQTSALTRFDSFTLLHGHTLQELMTTEFRATSVVLSRQNRPNLTIQLDRLDERSMGALYFALSSLTAITGTFWEVDPFNQPGVEEGKVYIREALSAGSSEPGMGRRTADDDDNSPVARLRRERSDY